METVGNLGQGGSLQFPSAVPGRRWQPRRRCHLPPPPAGAQGFCLSVSAPMTSPDALRCNKSPPGLCGGSDPRLSGLTMLQTGPDVPAATMPPCLLLPTSALADPQCAGSNYVVWPQRLLSTALYYMHNLYYDVFKNDHRQRARWWGCADSLSASNKAPKDIGCLHILGSGLSVRYSCLVTTS